jgi:epoxyqueuosine reductase QueG
MEERESLKGAISDVISRFIDDSCVSGGLENIWRTPVVRYADVFRKEVSDLKRVVHSEHYMPWDILENPRTIISYFLPFTPEVAKNNMTGEAPSHAWAEAYVRTNAMAGLLNDKIALAVREMGFRASVPKNIGTIGGDVIKSRWSQRHIAWLAGHGTFGVNNMLISDSGSCGRYFSVVTDIPVKTGDIELEERCLHKRNAACLVCVRRCPTGALTMDGFDRRRCYETCMKNALAFTDLNAEADVCGKCDVGLPCSFRNPISQAA